MDGFETYRNLKSNPRTSHIPVVILSVKHDISSVIRALREGASHYMVKPTNMTSFEGELVDFLRFYQVASHLSVDVA